MGMSMPRRSAQPNPGHLALADKLLEVKDEAGHQRAGQERLPSFHDIESLAEDFLTVLFPEVAHAAPMTAVPGDLRDPLAGVLASLEIRLADAVLAGIHR